MQQPEQLVQSFLLGSKQTRSGQRRLELLNKVDSLGSLAQAAKACGITYKGAWQAVEAMTEAAGEKIVHTQKGGAGGGGMVLTPAGKQLLSAYLLFQEQMQSWMRHLEVLSPGMLSQLDIMRKISMKTSARNLFHGTVQSILSGEVNCEVIISVGKDTEVVAQITPSSLERLGLEIGSDVYALIKASWVILAEDIAGMRTSARNQFCGTIVELEQGAVNSDVTLELTSGNRISAIVTNGSVEALDLAVGGSACALIKASHVLLAVAD
ncbi:ModE family transcriptional regulator [Thiosulfatimonas sediminis]|uniref:ModE family transcriptional regulator n=1 Tax=Thiosulfatimonas sediminis TaxID=2675054 RepID=A0A6F8PY62_9GAMM|nr:TOBE domain-containing protein [Thiosulfatimonas sediminis]BBP46934.1 ModE family transcriptional regulator [Thiosulfatimonas sediminis]